MYHFFSPAAGLSPSLPSLRSLPSGDTPASVPLGSPRSAALPPIDQLREVGPDEVEQPEDDRRDDRHDDHDDGRGADLLGGRPRHLLELARDLVGEVVNAI